MTAAPLRATPLVRAIGAAVRASGRLSALRRRPPVRAQVRELPMVVARTTPEATDVVSLQLVGVDGAERFAMPPTLGGRELTVELARSGFSLDVPSDRSVLEVVRERLPNVAYSCRQGFCGTCRVPVLVGEVEHRDRALTPAERVGAMTICVSRAAGDRLVLDL